MERKRRGPSLTDSARKRRKIERSKKVSAQRVYLGDQHSRWCEFKVSNNIDSHANVAKCLLDFYTQHKKQEEKGLRSTSTPAKSKATAPSTPSVSGISSKSSATEGEETISASEIHPGIKTDDSETSSDIEHLRPVATTSAQQQPVHTTKAGRQTQTKASSSFVDPFNLSIDVSTILEKDEDDEEDPDYEPSFEINAVLDKSAEQFEEMAFEEIAFNMEREDESDVEETEEDLGVGIKRVKQAGHCEPLTRATTCFAYVEQLKELAEVSVTKCSNCDGATPIEVTDSFIGSALYFTWVCGMGHVVHRWCAQPLLNRRLNSVDFLGTLAILTSGNNYGKLALWAKHLNLKFMSATTFHRIQKTYLVPTIDRYWEEKQQEWIESFQNEGIIVLGDGRNDSPGHSAQYCSYTFMEESTKKILTIQTLDKRTTDRKSGNMEKVAFLKGMQELREKGVRVEEVVTDAHLGIGAAMKSAYGEIKHSHDIWHAAKNLGKKLIKVAQKKENKILVEWQRDILNHFWFSCSKAQTYEEFLTIWRSLLHHITNQHSWGLSHGKGVNKCLHDPIDPTEERNKPWLSPSADGKALEALRSVILDKRLLKNVHYYLNFRSTAELEVFHQLILMYCAKRFAYTPPIYRIRNRLAGIDHNHNVSRPLRRNKDGEVMYHRCYNKKSNRWSVFPLKVDKDYSYVKDLAERALVMRVQDRVGMRKRTELEPDDPRRIAAHLAPVEPVPTAVLVKEMASRFSQK